MAVGTPTHDKFYTGVFSLLQRWDFLIVRVETLLLWERVIPSLTFNVLAHLIFWSVALTRQSSLFVLSIFLSIYFVCDLLHGKIARWLTGGSSKPNSFTNLVSASLERGDILSIEQLSYWISRLLRYCMTVINGWAPCRRTRPLLFFSITCSSSLACIWLSSYLSGLVVSYGILNLCLIAPVLVHRRVCPRLWHTVLPVLERIEAEFDRNALESASDRLEGEAALYGPIVAAALAAEAAKSTQHNDDDPYHENGVDSLMLPPTRGLRSGSEELDTSEAIFIKQFVPQTSGDEIDKIFSDVLDGASPINSTFPPNFPENVTYQLPTLSPGMPRKTYLADEYGTDDDEISDLNEFEVEDVDL